MHFPLFENYPFLRFSPSPLSAIMSHDEIHPKYTMISHLLQETLVIKIEDVLEALQKAALLNDNLTLETLISWVNRQLEPFSITSLNTVNARLQGDPNISQDDLIALNKGIEGLCHLCVKQQDIQSFLVLLNYVQIEDIHHHLFDKLLKDHPSFLQKLILHSPSTAQYLFDTAVKQNNTELALFLLEQSNLSLNTAFTMITSYTGKSGKAEKYVSLATDLIKQSPIEIPYDSIKKLTKWAISYQHDKVLRELLLKGDYACFSDLHSIGLALHKGNPTIVKMLLTTVPLPQRGTTTHYLRNWPTGNSLVLQNITDKTDGALWHEIDAYRNDLSIRDGKNSLDNDTIPNSPLSTIGKQVLLPKEPMRKFTSKFAKNAGYTKYLLKQDPKPLIRNLLNDFEGSNAIATPLELDHPLSLSDSINNYSINNMISSMVPISSLTERLEVPAQKQEEEQAPSSKPKAKRLFSEIEPIISSASVSSLITRTEKPVKKHCSSFTEKNRRRESNVASVQQTQSVPAFSL